VERQAQKAGAAELRAARKAVARLERRLDTLTKKVAELNEAMVAAGADPDKLTALDAELRAVLAEQEDVEAQWLAAAEVSESA
jgi:ATP-binding cassette subfamily F protein uup